MFEIKARDGLARIGILETAHGRISTPTILPVINPHFMPVHPNEMLEMGAQALITNSYIIYNDEKLRNRALKEGLHSLLNFNRPIMTDSGSFQMYMYGIEIDPIKIVKFQRDIGSDIGTILDIFSEESEYEEVKKEVAETLKRARESVKEKGKMLLACTVQGGVYEDLRRYCAKQLAKLRADVYPIGGVVPLMENQKFADIAEIIIASKKELPPSKPVHLFGAGHPVVFPMAVLLGCDLFDSASYIKYAKDERLIFPDKTLRLNEMDELPCCCPVCSKYNVDDLKEMDEEEKTRNIALHNLWQTLAEMKRIRQAIKHGTLWELAEQRAACHPSLQEAMEVIAGEKKWLEKWENISKKRAFIYTGRFSMHRPIAYRLRKRVMERYIPFFDKSVIFAEMEKPYSSKNEWMKKLEANCIIETPFGAIPLELDEIYPVAQSVFPLETDEESRKMAARMCSRFYRKLKIVSLNEIGRKSEDYDIRKIKSIANYQFGKGAGDALFDGKIGIRKSKTTGKIRNVYCNGKHVVSMRASDGFFTLKAEGGRRLHRFFSYPKMRVVVGDEAEPFIKEGRNVFAKFVVDACREIRPYDEVLIVSKEDELLAVGQCLMNRDEMLDFERGVAVKTREVCN
ncbi:MAG TPA: tRNA guanosine(15) transglycosylase TgtA [Thermoplasmatales archaeon]|nr:tRNA guanosine(15) transglycosylase TgtA [Thermoplasmatales archaeon]